MIITHAKIQDLEDIVELTYRHNNVREYSSNFFYTDREKIKKDVIEAIERSEVIICKNNNLLLGVLLWFTNKEHLMKDCNIFVTEDSEKYIDSMTSMVKKLLEINANTMDLNFFFPKENSRVQHFLEAMNATKKMNEYKLELRKNKEKNLLSSNFASLLEVKERNELAILHDRIFPDIYINGSEIVRNIEQNRTVYRIVEENEIVAYAVLKKIDIRNATAEIIGVKENHRGQGYGRKILSYLIEDAFARLNLTTLFLIVDGDNETAIHLYLTVGFKLITENNSYVIKME